MTVEGDIYRAIDALRNEVREERMASEVRVLAAVAAVTVKLDQIERSGSEGFNVAEAERRGRETAEGEARDAATSQRVATETNRRWLIALVIGNALTMAGLAIHLLGFGRS